MLVAAVAIGTLAACGPEESPDSADADPTSSVGAGAQPSATGTDPALLLECGQPTDTDKGLHLADLDLSTATWAVPEGFQQTFRYHEENPVEEVVSTWSAEPVPAVEDLNIVNVNIYTGLDWSDVADDCGRVPVEAVEARLAQYHAEIGAEPMSEAVMTTLAGQPAIEQYIHLAEYDYHGYWLFSSDQLLHAYCQWTNQKPLIEAACPGFVASIQVP